MNFPSYTVNLVSFFHPDQGGKGATTTIADLQDYCLTSAMKRLAVSWIRQHNEWLHQSDGKGTKAAKREAVLTTIRDSDHWLDVYMDNVPTRGPEGAVLFANNVINPHD